MISETDRQTAKTVFTIIAEIHSRLLAKFYESLCGQTHEFEIRATPVSEREWEIQQSVIVKNINVSF